MYILQFTLLIASLNSVFVFQILWKLLCNLLPL